MREARASLPRILERVLAGEEVNEVLEEAGRSPLRNDAGLSEERAEALLTELRASRSRG